MADMAVMKSPSAPGDPRYTRAVAIPDKLREEALRLPPAERAKLAAELFDSLDDADEEAVDAEEIEKAWNEEIRRRIEEIDSGKAEMISEEEFWKLLEG